MSQDWVYGPRCGIDNCSSRRYTIGDDGFKYCSRGHQAEDQLIGDDEEFMGAAAKKTKRGTDDEEEEVSKYLQGREAIELFLQCYQLMLRKQAWWLMKKRGFPANFEATIRDLWSLRLHMLKHMLEDPEAGIRLFASRTPSRGPSQSSQPTSETEESNAEDSTFGLDMSRSRLSHSMRPPRLVDSLGILYLGILLLRLPVSVRDLSDWTLTPGFSFTRAVEDLPQDMKQSLPPQMLKTFESRIGAPDPGTIHSATINIAIAYNSKFGMHIPEMNHHLLLFRHMKLLAMPLDVYRLTLSLAQLLKVNFRMPGMERGNVRLATHPEVQLISIMCVVIKLMYPFESESIPHVPRNVLEPASLALDWHKWQKIRRDSQHPQSGGDLGSHGDNRSAGQTSSRGIGFDADMLAVTQRDVLQMTASETDTYLDWFIRTWLPLNGFDEQDPGASDANDFVKALWRMFPLKINDSQVTSTKADEHPKELPNDSESCLRAVQASLLPITAEIGDSNLTHRPGDRYVHYRRVKDLPNRAKAFYSAAADCAGLSLVQLTRAVFSVEMRLESLLKREASVDDSETDKDVILPDVLDSGEDVASLDPFSLELNESKN